MTIQDKADSLGMTVSQLRDEEMEWLQCEGYDDDGREYPTLNKWLERRRWAQPTLSPQDQDIAYQIAVHGGEA